MRGAAIVIGGGTTGLTAARVLADAGFGVTLVERDTYPETPDSRPGAPQGQHVHILLRRGYDTLCQRFPTLADDLREIGAAHLRITRDLIYHGPAGRSPRFDSAFEIVTPSRPMLEWILRRRVAEDARITLRSGVKVDGLLADGARICGVQTADGPLEADLVVDASGRTSRTPRWLEALGFEAPAETEIPTRAAYVTRWFRHPDPPADYKAIAMLPPLDGGRRGGLVNPAERGTFIVTLCGIKGEVPPTDDAGFMAFAAAMPEPTFAEFLAGAEPIGPTRAWRKMGNRLRRYDRLRKPPGGLAVLGDAFCAFNPVYGQGITVGALGAEVLGEALDRGVSVHDPRFTRRLFRRLWRTARIPWNLATSQDIRHAAESGERAADLSIKLSSPYLDGVLRLITRSEAAFSTFMQVVHMVRSPAALAHPRFVLPVLWDLITPRRAS